MRSITVLSPASRDGQRAQPSKKFVKLFGDDFAFDDCVGTGGHGTGSKRPVTEQAKREFGDGTVREAEAQEVEQRVVKEG
ncbi:hypothetical protein LTS17_008522 [Exophiala oligosperma]